MLSTGLYTQHRKGQCNVQGHGCYFVANAKTAKHKLDGYNV